MERQLPVLAFCSMVVVVVVWGVQGKGVLGRTHGAPCSWHGGQQLVSISAPLGITMPFQTLSIVAIA